jgi:hypothetical protein
MTQESAMSEEAELLRRYADERWLNKPGYE